MELFISIAQSQSSIYMYIRVYMCISSITEVTERVKALLVLPSRIIQIPIVNIILICSFHFSAGLYVNAVR